MIIGALCADYNDNGANWWALRHLVIFCWRRYKILIFSILLLYGVHYTVYKVYICTYSYIQYIHSTEYSAVF